MSTDDVNIAEDADMAECDGDKVVTMMDVLQEQQEFEEDANAVLGASDDKNCTYPKGYIKRQALYACLTCCTEAKVDPTKRAGVCLACSLTCHENHELIELYTKRNFRCDCGNPKFNSHPCQFTSDKTELNDDNIYNQNFSGLYCTCQRPYPDPESTIEDDMIQCIICEDWLHASHLEAVVPANDQYSEMICKSCMEKNDFLHDYSMFAVTVEAGDVDIVTVNGDAKSTDSSFCNGGLEEKLVNGAEVNQAGTTNGDDVTVNGDVEMDEDKEKSEEKVKDDTDNDVAVETKQDHSSQKPNTDNSKINLDNDSKMSELEEQSVETSESNMQKETSENILEKSDDKSDAVENTPTADEKTDNADITDDKMESIDNEQEKTDETIKEQTETQEQISKQSTNEDGDSNNLQENKTDTNDRTEQQLLDDLTELTADNTTSEEKSDTAAEEKADTAAEKKADTAAVEKSDTAAKVKADTTAEEKANTAGEEMADITAGEKADTAAEEKADTAAEEKVDTAAEEKVDTAVEEKVDTAAEENKDTAAEENKYTAAEEKVDTENESVESMEQSEHSKVKDEIETNQEAISQEMTNESVGKSEQNLTVENETDTGNIEVPDTSQTEVEKQNAEEKSDLVMDAIDELLQTANEAKEKKSTEETEEPTSESTETKETTDNIETKTPEDVEMSDSEKKVESEVPEKTEDTDNSIDKPNAYEDVEMSDTSTQNEPPTESKVDEPTTNSEKTEEKINDSISEEKINDSISEENIAINETDHKLKTLNDTDSELKTNKDNDSTNNTEPSNVENGVPSVTENAKEHKRKLSTDFKSDISSKKVKLECVRPKNVTRIHKGATFWPSNFRQKLCTCGECISMYKDLKVLFLTDLEDTVFAYESLGKENLAGGASQYEKGMQALSSLDRIQQINALTEYNRMRDKLLDFLKSFKDRKEIVKEEDIKAFFAEMKPRREPDGVYFCR